MQSFVHKTDANDVDIKLPADGITPAELLAFHPFKTWINTLTHSLSLQAANPAHPFHKDPFRLRSVTVQSFDRWRGGIGFLKLATHVINGAGEELSGAVFLRGPAVAMLVILVPEDDPEERHVLLTVQPRVPAGSLEFVELPAGMVDDEGQFAGTAAREIKEELELEIPEAQLTNLSELAAAEDEGGVVGERLPNAMYPSAGGCDEYIPIYLHERKVPRAQLGEWTGRLTGLRDEGERITLKLVPMRDAWRHGARDAKCLSALALWEGLKREGKI